MKIISAFADFMVEASDRAAQDPSGAKATCAKFRPYPCRWLPPSFSTISLEEIMAWTKPQFADIRFGFEITMYIANR